MTITRPSFRNGLFGAALVAIILGMYLVQLWNPVRQIELHSLHLLRAIELNDALALGDFIDPTYRDQWQHDRALLLARVRALVAHARHLRFEPHEPIIIPVPNGFEWWARISATGDPGEVMTVISERINPLKQPFRLEWRQQSWKPWVWKLVREGNEELELPASGWMG